MSISILFPNQKIDNKVNDLISKMTLDEKIGQMTQIDRRFLNKKDCFQCILYGL